MNNLNICKPYQDQKNIVHRILDDLNYIISTDILQKFINENDVEKIIIYGSRAKGTWFESSDIDIILVSATDDAEGLISKLKETIYANISYITPLDITLYNFSTKVISHITYGNTEIFEEKITTHPFERDFSERFYQTECFILDGQSINYENRIFPN